MFKAKRKTGKAYFEIKAEDIIIRGYCNIHGLWKK